MRARATVIGAVTIGAVTIGIASVHAETADLRLPIPIPPAFARTDNVR